MKIFLILCSFLFISSTRADWQQDCHQQAEEYGGQKFIDLTCQNEIIKNASITKMDKNYKFYGWRNIMIIMDGKETFIISGDKSLLNEITWADLDIEKNMVVVLNKVAEKKQILIFKAKRSGNVSPARLIESKEVNELIEVSFKEGKIEGKGHHKNYLWDFSKDSRSVGLISPLN